MDMYFRGLKVQLFGSVSGFVCVCKLGEFLSLRAMANIYLLYSSRGLNLSGWGVKYIKLLQVQDWLPVTLPTFLYPENLLIKKRIFTGSLCLTFFSLVLTPFPLCGCNPLVLETLPHMML